MEHRLSFITNPSALSWFPVTTAPHGSRKAHVLEGAVLCGHDSSPAESVPIGPRLARRVGSPVRMPSWRLPQLTTRSAPRAWSPTLSRRPGAIRAARAAGCSF